MKTSLIASALLITALGTPVFAGDTDGVSPGTYVRDSGTYVKDSAIFVAVKSKLKAEHVDSYSHLQVITDSNGVVLLKGKVETQAEADRAVALAQAADNVKAVRNELVVKNSN